MNKEVNSNYLVRKQKTKTRLIHMWQVISKTNKITIKNPNQNLKLSKTT